MNYNQKIADLAGESSFRQADHLYWRALGKEVFL